MLPALVVAELLPVRMDVAASVAHVHEACCQLPCAVTATVLPNYMLGLILHSVDSCASPASTALVGWQPHLASVLDASINAVDTPPEASHLLVSNGDSVRMHGAKG